MREHEKPSGSRVNVSRELLRQGGGQVELYTVAFERSSTPMVLAAARASQNPIMFANDAFLKLTGYERDEVLDRDCRFLQGAGTSRDTIAEISSAVREGREVHVTILNYHKDGTEFWNQLHISPIRDSDGNVTNYFASQTDVSAARRLKALEASEKRLLKEVDHRAKNLMAVVNSIVRISKKGDPDRYEASVRQRVQALADVHELLANRRWHPVPLGELVGQQLAALGLTTVRFTGPDIAIDATNAQPIALIVHELAANAKLHGSLATAGTARVTWRLNDPQGFELEWVEHGRTEIAAIGKSGYGTKLVDALVEKQLRGRIVRTWLDDGLSIKITLPL